MEERRLRAAVIGAGFIGAVHARAARLAGARLVGVVASSPDSTRRAVTALGAERGFDAAEELVGSADVDVVHICTPNHLHGPLAEAALAAGKHVVCEKPLGIDGAQARALSAAAAGSDREAAVPFVYRYYPTVREARERVRAGHTGPLHLLHGTYLQDWLLSAEDHNWRVDEGLGGPSRAFADIGSHWCDLAEFVSGHRIARLSARTLTAVPERHAGDGRAAFARPHDADEAARAPMRTVTTEDVALVQFETDRGALGSVTISQVSAGRKNRLWIELDGAEEALAFDQENPETLWCGGREVTTLRYRDPATLSPPAARLATLPAGHPQGYADCFDLFVADVYAAIREGARPEGTPTFADGARAAQLTDAVLDSAREQRWVDVGASPAADDAGAAAAPAAQAGAPHDGVTR
jgi:predicted dehydrogenase